MGFTDLDRLTQRRIPQTVSRIFQTPSGKSARLGKRDKTSASAGYSGRESASKSWCQVSRQSFNKRTSVFSPFLSCLLELHDTTPNKPVRSRHSRVDRSHQSVPSGHLNDAGHIAKDRFVLDINHRVFCLTLLGHQPVFSPCLAYYRRLDAPSPMSTVRHLRYN